MRICKKCSIEKSLEQFNLSGWKDSRRWSCKDCESARKTEWYYENHEEQLGRVTGYRLGNPERIKATKDKEYAKNSDGYKARARARHLLMKGIESDPGISVTALLDRDGAACYLCDEDLDTTVKYPDPQSATIEHIIPVSKGGTNTWKNVKLAHAVCNRRKGAKIL